MAENYRVQHTDDFPEPKPEYEGWYVVGTQTGKILDGPMEKDAARARADEANGPASGPSPASYH